VQGVSVEVGDEMAEFSVATFENGGQPVELPGPAFRHLEFVLVQNIVGDACPGVLKQCSHLNLRLEIFNPFRHGDSEDGLDDLYNEVNGKVAELAGPEELLLVFAISFIHFETVSNKPAYPVHLVKRKGHHPGA